MHSGCIPPQGYFSLYLFSQRFPSVPWAVELLRQSIIETTGEMLVPEAVSIKGAAEVGREMAMLRFLSPW